MKAVGDELVERPTRSPKDIARASRSFGLPFLKDLIRYIQTRQSSPEEAFGRWYQLDLLRTGRFSVPSPRTGVLVSSRGSLLLNDKSTFYSFDEDDLFLEAASIGEGFPLSAVVIPSRRVMMKLSTEAFGPRIEHTATLLAALEDESLRDALLAGGVRDTAVITGDPSFAHHAWNQLGALDAVARDPELGHLEIAVTNEPLGRIREMFPDRPEWKWRYVDGNDLLSLNTAATLFVPLAGYRVTSSVRDRLQLSMPDPQAAETDEIAQTLRANYPIFWISVRSRNRTATNQVEALSVVCLRLLDRYDECAIIFDGHSTPEDATYIRFWTDEFLRPLIAEDREVIRLICERVEAARPPSARQRLVNASGLSVRQSIRLASTASAYLCHHGTVQHKIGWFTDVPGIVHCNRAVIRNNPAGAVAMHSEGAALPTYIPEELVADVAQGEPESTREGVLHLESYTVRDPDRFAEYVISTFEQQLAATPDRSTMSESESRRRLPRYRDQADSAAHDLAAASMELAKARMELGNSRMELGNSRMELANSRRELANSRRELASVVANADKKAVALEKLQTEVTKLTRGLEAERMVRANERSGRPVRRRIKAAALTVAMRLPLGWTNPLFDEDWYVASYPDVKMLGKSPHRHYRRHGAREGRNPSPLFDTNWYLAQYPDVAMSGMNPLDHYLRYGGEEGRNPSLRFDANWYLGQHEDVRAAGINPLLHYVQIGAREGRATAPVDSSNPAPVADQKLLPTAESYRPSAIMHVTALIGGSTGQRRKMRVESIKLARSTPAPLASGEFNLICLSHVKPWPARAGNEYRLHRLLQWLGHQGWQTLLLYAPLPSEQPSSSDIQELVSHYPETILVGRDGLIRHALPEGDTARVVSDMNGKVTRDFGRLLGETQTGSRARVEAISREFCTDPLAEVAVRLDEAISPRIVLANYVFMSRVLPLMSSGATKIIDTIDVFSNKHNKVVAFGLEDSLALSTDDESYLLGRADLAIAIQDEEAATLSGLSGTPVVTAGVDHPVTSAVVTQAAAPVALLVGSGNHPNRKGLADFLRYAWPRVLSAVPGTSLRVVGSVGDTLSGYEPGVVKLGRVVDLDAEYNGARVVINPAAAGTGLKIKTVEALAHLRPLVGWPAAADGLAPELRALCTVTHDWYEFTECVIEALHDESSAGRLIAQRDIISRLLSPEHVYSGLAAVLPTPASARAA